MHGTVRALFHQLDPLLHLSLFDRWVGVVCFAFHVVGKGSSTMDGTYLYLTYVRRGAYQRARSECKQLQCSKGCRQLRERTASWFTGAMEVRQPKYSTKTLNM